MLHVSQNAAKVASGLYRNCNVMFRTRENTSQTLKVEDSDGTSLPVT